MSVAASIGTMRAAVIDTSRRIGIRGEVRAPSPSANEVRIAVEGCGVCASSLPLWQGRPWFQYPAPPGAPGHEGWGVIDAAGEGVTDLSVGQRVAFLSGNAFAEFDVASADGVVVLPPALHNRLFPAEAIGCAMNAFRRSDIQRGHSVAIVGIGFLGALLVRLAVNAGARVVAISRRPYALALARSFGAEETIFIDRADPRALPQFDRAIEAIGSQQALDAAGELVREGGRLIIAGYHQDGTRTVNMQLWNWKGIDVVNAHERDRATCVRGMREAIDAVASERLDVDRCLTPFRFDSISDAFRALEQRPDGFVKAVVTI
ncbi:MAG: L-iditol 2-dehydrogenase [Acidobacteria bacterium]|nr:MAG: L-iditol 2-dehydrogenase [Acidobacteriota bacterium]